MIDITTRFQFKLKEICGRIQWADIKRKTPITATVRRVGGNSEKQHELGIGPS